jgi:hypothetical protein
MSGLPGWARVGAKIVCIDDTFDASGTGKEHQLTKGMVYTIMSIRWPFLRLSGTYNGRGGPGGFLWHRFRPLVTLSSDIAEHFEHLLDVPASHEREAEAA